MAGTGLRKPEIDGLKLRLRQLESLRAHGLGQIGSSVEIHEARQLIREIKDRLDPKPPTNLELRAAELIARFGPCEWVVNALNEAEGDVKCTRS